MLPYICAHKKCHSALILLNQLSLALHSHHPDWQEIQPLMEQGSPFPSSGLYPGLEGMAESRTFIEGSSGLWVTFLI